MAWAVLVRAPRGWEHTVHTAKACASDPLIHYETLAHMTESEPPKSGGMQAPTSNMDQLGLGIIALTGVLTVGWWLSEPVDPFPVKGFLVVLILLVVGFGIRLEGVIRNNNHRRS